MFEFRSFVVSAGLAMAIIDFSSEARADEPLNQLPAEVQELANLPDQALEDFFRAGTAPKEIPSGRALGYHLFRSETIQRAPLELAVAAKALWRAKIFEQGENGSVMVDDLGVPPPLDLVKANVLIGSALDILNDRYPGHDADHLLASLDDQASLITDYFSWPYPRVLDPVAQPVRPWLDEYRIVDPTRPGLLLGRSLYSGRFWCWVILEFETN